ncbi:MAG: hypothetical protein V2J89_05815 [Halieaceae bacterium]|jgi:hypothetical protein|nr:hypothetical protein [Halieaceae bacterium]
MAVKQRTAQYDTQQRPRRERKASSVGVPDPESRRSPDGARVPQELEAVPAKSPHRKYLVLLALHMVHTDDPQVFSRLTDCSERTFHYVKSRLCKHDGVIISYDRRAGRYVVVHSGVLDLSRVAELMKRHYPRRFAYIEQLARDSKARFLGS